MDYPLEPFKIKVIEPLELSTREEREKLIKRAYYNLFNVPSKSIIVDLLTDSGTGAMSQDQWASMFKGDEAYAGAKSFENFENAVKKFTGKKFVLPVHQGRAAEKIIAQTLINPGDIVISNTFFDTTGANFAFRGAELVEVPAKEAEKFSEFYPFKGNADIEKLKNYLERFKKENQKVALFTMTVTNNTLGGQPVSIENIRKVSEILKEHNIPLHIDACRISENSYFIKKREKGYENKSILEIIHETLSHADIVTMSAKKDGLANIGGFIATDNEELYWKFSQFLVLWEGFLTYGGLAGRDLEAISVGLFESVNEEYLSYRIGQVEYLVERLREIDIPVMYPAGGHAVYVDAGKFLPHIPKEHFPGQALAVALYVEGGIRGVELGSLMFGKAKKTRWELVRLAIPRRVYTRSHLDYVVKVFERIKGIKGSFKGFRIVYEPPYLRHFLVKLEPVEE